MNKNVLLLPIIALTSITSLFTILSPVKAISPSPSSSPTASPASSPASINEVTENIKKRLQESLGSKESVTGLDARAYIGIVKDVIKDTIIMQDKDGKKDIKIEDDTVILRSPGSAVIKPENIRIDDYIIAIGYPGESDTLSGRRLIVSIDPIKAPGKTSGIGTIEKIGKTSVTLKVEDKDQLINTTAKTIYKSSVGTIELADLGIGDTIIFTATTDSDNELTGTILMRTKTASISE